MALSRPLDTVTFFPTPDTEREKGSRANGMGRAAEYVGPKLVFRVVIVER